MIEKWLVIYDDGTGMRAKLLTSTGDSFPLGLTPQDVGEDCEAVCAVVSCPWNGAASPPAQVVPEIWLDRHGEGLEYEEALP